VRWKNKEDFLMKRLLALLALLLSSCGTLQAASPQAFTNKADMPFSIDNLQFKGVASVARKSSHVLKFTLPKSVERIVLTTCHGTEEILAPANPFTYNYIPVHLIEDVDSCIVKVESASKEAPMTLAVIDFYGEETKLPAWLTCNRISLRTGGASICQVAAGLIQRITFDEEVAAQEGEGCNLIACTGGNCLWKQSPKYCVYVFKGIKSGNYHRMTTRGTLPSEN
jgi:hypothetical protein